MYGNDFGSGAAGLGSLLLLSDNHLLATLSVGAFALAATGFLVGTARRARLRPGS
jgi:hypothetical protein